MSNFSKLTTLLAIVIGLTNGCAVDEDDDFDDALVIDITADDEAIGLGDGTRIRTYFAFNKDNIFDDDDEVALVIKLPPGLRYLEDSAEIDETFGDSDLGARVRICESGESYVAFNMDEHDLNDVDDPHGDALAKLTITIEGQRLGRWVIEARAREEVVLFGCNDDFRSDRSVELSVVPKVLS